MAKKCSTCNRTYPDNLPACPHCNPAQAGHAPADEAVLDDIEIVGEEAPKPPAAKAKKPAPPRLPPAEEPIEVVEEVHEVDAADVVELAEAKPAPGAGDSSRVNLDEPVEVVDVPSDMLVAQEATPADSNVRLDRLAQAGAPPAPPPPPGAAKTGLARGSAQPTQIASRAPAPTMLADSDAADELPGSELGGPAAPRDLPAEGAGAEEVTEAVEEVTD